MTGLVKVGWLEAAVSSLVAAASSARSSANTSASAMRLPDTALVMCLFVRACDSSGLAARDGAGSGSAPATTGARAARGSLGCEINSPVSLKASLHPTPDSPIPVLLVV